MDFVVDGALYAVPAGKNRSVVMPVAQDAAYGVLVSFPGASQTFSGVLSCSPEDSGSSSTAPPSAAGEPDPSQPSGASVPGEPADGPDANAEADGVLGQRAAAPSGGSVDEAGLTAAGEANAVGGRAEGSADARGSAVGPGGRLAVTGAPDLLTASTAASGLLAVGAGLFLFGRSGPRRG